MSLLKDQLELKIEETALVAKKTYAATPVLYKWLAIIAIAGIIPSYYLMKFVSYQFWTFKYKNLLITARPSFDSKEVQPLQVKQVILNKLGNNTYSLAAIIENKNLELSLNQQPYEFKLTDSDGFEITPTNSINLSGKFFLLPGQTKYIVVPKIVTSKPVYKTTINFTSEPQWQKRLQIPNVKLTATPAATFNQLDPEAFIIQGDVINNSAYSLGKIVINFLVKDSRGQVIGANQRTEFTMIPGERRTYRLVWPDFNPDEVATVQVLPETNVFDSINLTVPKLQNNSSSDLSKPSGNGY